MYYLCVCQYNSKTWNSLPADYLWGGLPWSFGRKILLFCRGHTIWVSYYIVLIEKLSSWIWKSLHMRHRNLFAWRLFKKHWTLQSFLLLLLFCDLKIAINNALLLRLQFQKWSTCVLRQLFQAAGLQLSTWRNVESSRASWVYRNL